MSGNYGDPRNMGRFGAGQTPNPFYSIANQFVPRNLHDVIRWSRYVMTQSPTVTEVIRKFSTYPITEFEIVSDNPGTQRVYQEIIKSIRLKQTAFDVGINYHTIGNDFLSVYFPILRNLECPSCKHTVECSHALRKKFAVFKDFRFRGTCPRCKGAAVFRVKDTVSKTTKGINIISWPAEHISVNNNPITGNSEYWYTIPNDVKKRIMAGDPNFVASIPMEMIEAVKNKQNFLFDKDSIYHVKGLSMGNILPGLGMPPFLSLYASIFHQTLLKRANEAIATEHMTPMRVVYPNQASAAGDPIAMMSMQGFVGKMEAAFMKHKQDPNHLIVAPVPIGYQAIGGQGRALLVTQELQFVEETILMGMGVSRELLSGTTNWTSSTVGLRLLENTLFSYTSEVVSAANWILTKIASHMGIEVVEVKLRPFKLTDDDSFRQAAPQLMEAGLVSPSTTLSAFGLDLRNELEKMEKDAVTLAVASADKQNEVRIASFMKTQELNDESTDESGIREIRKQAYEMAASIITMTDPGMKAQALFQLKAENPAMYEQVDTIMDEYTKIIQKQMGMLVEDPEAKSVQTQDIQADAVGPDAAATTGQV